MITRRAKYAIQALLCLAGRRGEGPVLAGDIAAEARLPGPYLEQILGDLRRRGIVASRKGRNGGHLLVRDPESLSLLEILRAVDGPVAPLPCLSKTAYAKCDDCVDETTCAVRALLSGVHEATLRALGKTMLADGLRLRQKQPREKRHARTQGR
ncbi:MAG: Rrf2 family transcriptional regulator [Planctomycetes bacterium]|jgi:Rrf2 family protein|nr:Rrf2 family transcriptional regulator [Planctomycetota bacterium]